MFEGDIGIDIIEIADFQGRPLESQQAIINQALYPEEIEAKLESNLGKIAAKEAIIKTGFSQPGEWKKVKIIHDNSGKPLVFDRNDDSIKGIKISITHSANTVVAIALYDSQNN